MTSTDSPAAPAQKTVVLAIGRLPQHRNSLPLQMRMTSDLGFTPPVGFSADGQTLYFAPCWDTSKGMPCVTKRSTDGGLT